MLMKLLGHSKRRPEETHHIFLCVADHWEPKWNRPATHVERDRVARWVNEYPKLARPLADSRGRPPQHTFFYPEEEYEPEHLEAIAGLCRAGLGDVEVHLHHDHDTSASLREKLDRFTHALHDQHGLLRKDADGRIRYGFIHGNWALDNSCPDGRWCGVNDEISVLIETGCCADFTMPSAPAECQTSTINSIYYATDDRQQPKSHDRGILAQVGARPPDQSLLMIQGPLGLDWGSRKWGLLPRIENGDLTKRRPPTLARLRLWLDASVGVSGREDWVFVKLHTHGTQDSNADMLLGEPMRLFHESLRRFAQEHDWFRYYYVTAHEMASLVHQAESGAVLPDWPQSAMVTQAAVASEASYKSVRES
jgi:hypothetical protein